MRVKAPETHAAQQVAYAWQVAARDLRFTHPELHALLTEKVRRLLDVEVLDDPAIELQRVQSAMAVMKAELDELRQALADAVPGIDNKVPPPEAARLRMRLLIEAGSRGSGLAPPAHLRAEPVEVAPTRADLQAVAEGHRSLTREQREWCVGEAMVLTDFQRTPVQLLEGGEAALARIILDAKPHG